MRGNPTIPTKGKWTKVAPCTGYFLAALAPNKFLWHVLVKGLAKIKTKFTNAADEDQYLEWHQVAGRRFLSAKENLGSADFMVGLVTLAIILEPVRFLTAYFLRRAKQVFDPCRWPGVCDLAGSIY